MVRGVLPQTERCGAAGNASESAARLQREPGLGAAVRVWVVPELDMLFPHLKDYDSFHKLIPRKS